MRSFGTAMAVISVGFLATGMAWPHLAERMLQMLVATLALGFVGARIYRSALPVRMTHEAYSPFETREATGPPPKSPTAIRHLASQLEALEDRADARRVAIPGAAAQIIVSEASRRLAEHHGLSVQAPGDHHRIGRILSQPTWALIRGVADVGPADIGSEATAPRGPVPLSELGRILDDLERL